MDRTYFERTGPTSFLATEHVGGAWRTDEQHIAPALGLMAHVVELDRDRRRDDGLVLSRVSYDILGVLPLAEVEIEVRLVRPGRSVELVEAVLSHGGRAAVVLRAWLLAPGKTGGLSGTDLPRLPAHAGLDEWDPTSVWPGGFIASISLRRAQRHPGRAAVWASTALSLLDEPVSPTAAALGLADIANGMTVRADPTTVAFPNVDLTAHLFRAPRPGWLGFDTFVSFGPTGLGVTSSVLHDEDGPFGTLNQSLTVRLG